MGDIANRLNNTIREHSCVNEYVQFHFAYLVFYATVSVFEH